MMEVWSKAWNWSGGFRGLIYEESLKELNIHRSTKRWLRGDLRRACKCLKCDIGSKGMTLRTMQGEYIGCEAWKQWCLLRPTPLSSLCISDYKQMLPNETDAARCPSPILQDNTWSRTRTNSSILPRQHPSNWTSLLLGCFACQP